MPEGVNLLQEVKAGSYHSAILGSYNVSFPFFEEVVLRGLRAHGCDHTVLLMDESQCAASLGDPEMAPHGAGRTYALVPVRAPGVFHPKFALLLGKLQSKLLLGSHNLTLSGFGLNREITSVIDLRTPVGAALGREVFAFALDWAQTTSSALAELVQATTSHAPWLTEIAGEASGADFTPS